MAYTRMLHIKTKEHLQQAIDYIIDPDKTNDKMYTASFNCDIPYAVHCFEEIFMQAKTKKGNNFAHHIVQSFAPEDNITPEQAMRLGQELMRRLYPDYQYVIATHVDRGHIHNHIIFNAVNFETFKKLHCNKKNLEFVRNTSDDLCKKNGLSIIPPDTIERRNWLMEDIDLCIKKANSFDSFISLMKKEGYQIKIGEKLSVKGITDERFRRLDTLGTAYTEKNIRRRIDGAEIPNERKKIYSDKDIRMSNRKRLKYAINDILKHSDSFEDFILKLQDEEIEIKRGKHLAMRFEGDIKFLRTKSIGEEYTEENLRLYFEDRSAYEEIKKAAQATRIEKLSMKNSRYNKYTAARNVDIQIRMLNMLNENGVRSIAELKTNIAEYEQKIADNKAQIKALNEKSKSNRDIVKAIRNYWRLKPVFEEYNSLKSLADKEIFMLDNKKKIEDYTAAVEIINRSKNADGTLPKAAYLNAEIMQNNDKVSEIEEQTEQYKTELYKYQTLLENLKALGIDTGEEEQTEPPERKTLGTEEIL